MGMVNDTTSTGGISNVLGIGGMMGASVLGSMLGGSGGSKGGLSSDQQYVNSQIKGMNNLLSTALSNAMGAYGQGTNQAISQLNNTTLPQITSTLQKGLADAISAYNTGLSGATSAATTNLNNAVNQYRTLQAPFAQAGYNALDSYMDSLGLSRPAIGSSNLVNSMQNVTNTINPQLAALKSAATANAGANPYLTPTQQALANLPNAPSLRGYVPDATTAQITDYLNGVYGGVGGNIIMARAAQGIPIGQSLAQQARQTLAAGVAAQNNAIAQQNSAAQNAYNKQVADINSANQNKINLFNAQQGAYNTLQNTLSNSNPLLLQQALSAQSGLFNPARVVNVGFGGSI